MTKQDARKWMQANVRDYVDRGSDEVDLTALAEACAGAFDQKDEGGPLDDETHFIWDVAVEVAEMYEQTRQN